MAINVPLFEGTVCPAAVAAGYAGGGYCADGSEALDIHGNYLPCAYWSFVHRGFVYARQSGGYTVTITGPVDDQLLVWFGDYYTVSQNYNTDNAILVGTLGGPWPRAYTHTATAGEYIALRILMFQVVDGWTFSLQITAPDGSTILDGQSQSDALVQFLCDGTSSFLPWGSEALVGK